jgi:hypothetical protein
LQSGFQSLVVLLAAAMVAGCAQSPATDSAQLANTAPPGTVAPYTLSAEEQGLDCKSLTGRMHVRILQMRGHANKGHPTGLSQGIKSATKTVWGQASEGPDAQFVQDRARLEAYNGLLATKKCATFDLEKELHARPSAPAPSPVAPVTKPPAAKTAS